MIVETDMVKAGTPSETLHRMLDEAAADYLSQHKPLTLLSDTTLRRLIDWHAEQIENPVDGAASYPNVENHKARHKVLHAAMVEISQLYQRDTGKRADQVSVLDLLPWSFERTKQAR